MSSPTAEPTGTRRPVGLILVSHSAALSAGVAELVGQMAPDVQIQAVGGAPDGSLGTSYPAVGAAIAAETGQAVLLYDLGGARLTAEMALESAAPAAASRIILVDAPLLEGAIAAAVAAQGGAALSDVVRAAAGTATDATDFGADRVVSETAVLVNRHGLHARPAAALGRVLEGLRATVSIGRPGGPQVPVRNVLRLIGLALRGGEAVQVSARGPAAVDAVRAAVTLIATGFGETITTRLPPTAMGSTPVRLGTQVRAPQRDARESGGIITAEPAAPGLAIGELVTLDRAPLLDLTPSGHGDQRAVLTAAIAVARQRLAGGNQFQAAHAAMLNDPDLAADAAQRLDSTPGNAAAAWWAAVSDRAAQLAADPDDLIAGRAIDLREAGAAVLAELGVGVDRVPQRGGIDGAVILAEDLGPGEVPALAEQGASAVVLSGGSPTSHAVIVAKGLGLPVVVQAGTKLQRLRPGTVLAVDGQEGTVTIDPPVELREQIEATIAVRRAEREQRRVAAAEPVVLGGGRRIAVTANIGSLADARAAVSGGADGVGLLRTELLLLDRDALPDEDTQTADLAAILQVLGDRPVVVRVLDVGGDKQVTALNLDSRTHGVLGRRGLRYLLTHPQVLHLQLRAILRAAVGRRVSVMAPMITLAQEVLDLRAAIDQAAASLAADGLAHRRPDRIGAMIEVPAAALAADEICAVSDFVSIGSNDLTGYVMAADRAVPEVAAFLQPRSVAVQRLLDMTFELAARTGTPVSVCGEIAGVPDLVPGLVARGAVELSVAPARIPEIKELLRGLPDPVPADPAMG